MKIIRYKGYGNALYFDNDDEFFNFAVDPILICTTNDTGCPSYTFNFTPGYQDALNHSKCFIINDKKSNIYKHKCVSYKTMSKGIQNLQHMTYDKYLKKKYPEYLICTTYGDD